MQDNFSRGSEYETVVISVEGSLVHIKSGEVSPKNIADFTPDYNLWYAIKFCKPKEIWVIENTDLTSWGWNTMPLSYYQTRYEYISKWLSQVTNTRCRCIYSLHGDWKVIEEEIPDLIRKWTESERILFIDKDTKENEGYIKTKNLMYTTISEFTGRYNKNPRKK